MTKFKSNRDQIESRFISLSTGIKLLVSEMQVIDRLNNHHLFQKLSPR